MRHQLDREIEAGKERDPAAYFDFHPQQIQAKSLNARVVMVLGGTQSGKSTTAKSVIADIVRRRSVLNQRLMIDTATGKPTRDLWRPLTIWAATPTGEKFRLDWSEPAHGESLEYWLGDTFLEKKLSPDLYYKTRVQAPNGQLVEDKIIAKSYDQGYLSFESSVVDIIVFDEEPPEVKIVNSALGRLATTNGVLFMAFTPLEGMSWSYHKWYGPCVERGGGQQIGDRCWFFEEQLEGMPGRSVAIVQMGTSDNPKARVYDRELETDPTMLEAEKQARRFGHYGYVEGLLFPQLAGFEIMHPNADHAIYVIDDPKGLPRDLSFHLIADPNYSYGAVLVGLDGDGNRYLLKSHLEVNWPNRRHADVFREWAKQCSRKPLMWADMGSSGKQSKCDLNDLGLPFQPLVKPPGSVSTSIKGFRGWLYVDPDHRHPSTGEFGAPRVYFYKPGLVEKWEEDGMKVVGSRLIQQLATVKQMKGGLHDSIDKAPEHPYDLFDCARYATLCTHSVADGGRPGATARRERYRDKRLPTAEELKGARRPALDPLDAEIFVPEISSWRVTA